MNQVFLKGFWGVVRLQVFKYVATVRGSKRQKPEELPNLPLDWEEFIFNEKLWNGEILTLILFRFEHMLPKDQPYKFEKTTNIFGRSSVVAEQGLEWLKRLCRGADAPLLIVSSEKRIFFGGENKYEIRNHL